MNSKIVILHKKVSNLGYRYGNDSAPSSTGKAISLPKLWVEKHQDPRKVIVCLGDILIVGVEKDEQKVWEIAEHLVAEGMITLIGERKNTMRPVGETRRLVSVD